MFRYSVERLTCLCNDLHARLTQLAIVLIHDLHQPLDEIRFELPFTGSFAHGR